MKRARHLPTVALLSFNRPAIELLVSPSALLRMMRARPLSEPGSERLRENDVSCARSSSVITSSAFGLPLFMAISRSKRYPEDTHHLCQLVAGQHTRQAVEIRFIDESMIDFTYCAMALRAKFEASCPLMPRRPSRSEVASSSFSIRRATLSGISTAC